MRPSDDLIVSATEPTGANRKKVWMQKGKNLFNKNDIAKGYGFLATGELTTNSNLFVSTEYLPVNSSVEYTLGNSSSIDRLVICEYDSSKTFIKRNIILNSSTLTITTTSTTKYIKLNSVISALDTLQLEQGSTATSYEAYIEPKMYVKNDNDVYEEFISKENMLEKYSTEETKIGTWINGKPLYRKVITYNEYITKNILVSVSHNITNLENIVKCEAILQWSNNFYPFPTHYQNQENEVVVNSIDSSNINFTSYGDNWGEHVIYFTLEYTKTTD